MENIKMLKIEILKDSEYNPRQITKDELKKLEQSVKEFGLVQPIVVNINPERENVVISGHQRLEVAKKLGMKEVPCMLVDLSLTKEKALNLAMNKIGGRFEEEKLIDLLSAIEKPESEIYLTKGEDMDGKVFCEQHKPLITLQAVGGLPPGMMPGRLKVDSSQRDIPNQMAAYIVHLLRQQGFNVLQLRNKVEPQIPGTLQIDLPFRNIMPIVKHAVGHIGIDSSWMHVAGCFKKPMLTFWGGTHKDNFGYNHEKSFHAFTKNAMHGRPYFAVHDRCALYPYKDKREGFEFDFSMRDIEKHVGKFVDSIKNKEGGKNVESN